MNSDKNNIDNNVRFGVYHEQLFYPELKQIFPDIKKSENEYCYYDFYNKNCIIELKTRDITYNNFISKSNNPNIWITKYKIDNYLLNLERKPFKLDFYIFNKFVGETTIDEQIFYIKYNKQQFDNYKIEKDFNNNLVYCVPITDWKIFKRDNIFYNFEY